MNKDPEQKLAKPTELEALGRDLTRLAWGGELEPIYGRDEVVERVTRLLAVGQNVILVGEPGVGKNAIVERLAQAAVSAYPLYYAARYGSSEPPENRRPSTPVPTYLQGRPIIECLPAAFVAGCIYAGYFETKMKSIASHCRSEEAILFIDDIHLAVEIGGTVEGAEDRTVANLLSPYLSRGEVVSIGATTPAGYNLALRRSPTFVARFVRVDVPPLSSEETTALLLQVKAHFEDRHGQRLQDDGVVEIVEVAERFLPGRAFPGKAFELLREVIASADKPEVTIDSRYVRAVASKKTGLPDFIVDPALPKARPEIVRFFEEAVYGQEQAIGPIADALLTFKALLNDPSKPVAVFLFVGPTGVGKTLLARRLAEYLFGSEDRLLRYDMSEYADPEGPDKLIGSRWHSRQGRLVEDVLVRPFSVVLFDEIEKAHRSVFNLLLQVFGEGRLTDAFGRTADFRNAIIVLTSNLGSDVYGRTLPGFAREADDVPAVQERTVGERIKEFFAPEFLNRITKVIHFCPLSPEIVTAIARKELERVADRRGIRARRISLQVEEDVFDLLMRHGYTPEYGARPMQRAVEELVVHPLAARLAAGEIADGETVHVCVTERVQLDFVTGFHVCSPLHLIPSARKPRERDKLPGSRRS